MAAAVQRERVTTAVKAQLRKCAPSGSYPVMKAALQIVLLILVSWSSPDAVEHNRLMDKIEQQLRMPKGAAKIEHYSRFYAMGQRDHVIAVYTEEAGLGLPTGQRRWVKSEADLPVIMDGGCSVVTVDFDRRSGKIIHTDCNGDA